MSPAGDGPGARRDRQGWPDAALAEQLLTLRPPAGYASGSAPGPGGAGAGDPRVAGLVQVLDAAARPLPVAPAREAAALAAFRQARAERGTRRRRRGVPVKALVSSAAAVFALGGVAVAAQQGRLAHPFHGGSGTPRHSAGPGGHSTHRPPSSLPPGGRPAPGGSGDASPAPTLTGGSGPGALPPSGAATTPGTRGTSSLKGLCESYLRPGTAGRLSERGMQQLTQAAGGSARVGPYCRGLVSHSATPATPATPETPSPVRPTASAHPSRPAATTPAVPSHPDVTAGRGVPTPDLP